MAPLDPLQFEIAKLVIDKVLIGLLIGLVAFVGSVLLERYKAKAAFHSELNKIRVARIAETWEKVYLLNDQIGRVLQMIGRAANRRKQEAFLNAGVLPADGQYMREAARIDIESREELTRVKERWLEDLNASLQKNRFWLDQASYDAIRGYAEIVEEITEIREFGLGEESERRRAALSNKLEAAQGNVNAVRDRMFTR
jgi:hypothetical protein